MRADTDINAAQNLISEAVGTQWKEITQRKLQINIPSRDYDIIGLKIGGLGRQCKVKSPEKVTQQEKSAEQRLWKSSAAAHVCILLHSDLYGKHSQTI